MAEGGGPLDYYGVINKVTAIGYAARAATAGIGNICDTLIEYIKWRNNNASEKFVENENIFKQYMMNIVRPMFVQSPNRQMLASAAYFSYMAYGIYYDNFNENICKDPTLHLKSICYNATSIFQRPRFAIYRDDSVPCVMIVVRGSTDLVDYATDIDIAAATATDRDSSPIWEQTYVNLQFMGEPLDKEKLEKFKEYVTMCKFHKGFLMSAMNIMFRSGFNILHVIEKVYKDICKDKGITEVPKTIDLPIYCVGHSLGASTAGMIACLLRMFGCDSHGVLFAPAPFISPEVDVALNASRYMFSVVHRWDAITRLEPSVIRNGMKSTECIISNTIKNTTIMSMPNMDEPQLIIPGNVWWINHDDIMSSDVERWGMYYMQDRKMMSILMIPSTASLLIDDHSMKEYVRGLCDIMNNAKLEIDYVGFRAHDALFLKPDLNPNDMYVQLIAGSPLVQHRITQRHIEILKTFDDNSSSETITEIGVTEQDVREVNDAVMTTIESKRGPTHELKDLLASIPGYASTIYENIPTTDNYFRSLRVLFSNDAMDQKIMELIKIAKTLATCVQVYLKRVKESNEEWEKSKYFSWMRKKVETYAYVAGKSMGAIFGCLRMLVFHFLGGTPTAIGTLKAIWVVILSVIQSALPKIATPESVNNALENELQKMRAQIVGSEYYIAAAFVAAVVTAAAMAFTPVIVAVAGLPVVQTLYKFVTPVIETYKAAKKVEKTVKKKFELYKKAKTVTSVVLFGLSAARVVYFFYRIYNNYVECVSRCGGTDTCYRACAEGEAFLDDMSSAMYYYPRITKKGLSILGNFVPSIANSIMVHPALQCFDFSDVVIKTVDEKLKSGLVMYCKIVKTPRAGGAGDRAEEGVRIIDIVKDVVGGNIKYVGSRVLPGMIFRKYITAERPPEETKRKREKEALEKAEKEERESRKRKRGEPRFFTLM